MLLRPSAMRSSAARLFLSGRAHVADADDCAAIFGDEQMVKLALAGQTLTIRLRALGNRHRIEPRLIEYAAKRFAPRLDLHARNRRRVRRTRQAICDLVSRHRKAKDNPRQHMKEVEKRNAFLLPSAFCALSVIIHPSPKPYPSI